MNRKFFGIYIFIIMSLFIILFIGCEADIPPSLFDPNADPGAAPVITAISPQDSTLAGIGEIVISGQNFSSQTGDNLVFFNKDRVEIISASATEIRLKSPNMPSDSIVIKIAKQGAIHFSNEQNYKLKRAVWQYGGFNYFDDVYGIACDKNENLYVSSTTRIIEKVTPDEVRQDFGSTIFLIGSAMRITPDDYLYISRRSKPMYRIPLSSGGAAAKWTSAPGKIYDFDFSPSGICYAGGDNDDLYLIKPDGTGSAIAAYPDTYIKAVKVYDGYVYVGGGDKTAEHQYVWRHQIVSDSELGSQEVYFDWTDNIGEFSEVLSIVFDEFGDMYIGTDAEAGIIIVHPDGSFEPLYPGVIEPTTYAMAWGPGQFLYVNRRSDIDSSKVGIIKINMLKNGAP